MYGRGWLAVVLSVCLIQATVMPHALAAAKGKGGAGPFMASCCIGPRVGLEMNEDKPIQGVEWIRALGGFIPYVGFLVTFGAAIYQGTESGFNGVMASCCIGPRVGEQLKDRKIRSREWATLIPIIGLIPGIMIAAEAAKGRTMQEIEAEEKLKR